MNDEQNMDGDELLKRQQAMDNYTASLYSIFQSALHAGFTEQQAMQVVEIMVRNNTAK